jgi:hypothetical protein
LSVANNPGINGSRIHPDQELKKSKRCFFLAGEFRRNAGYEKLNPVLFRYCSHTLQPAHRRVSTRLRKTAPDLPEVGRKNPKSDLENTLNHSTKT